MASPQTPGQGRDTNPRHAICLHPGDLELVLAVLRREPGAMDEFARRMAVVPRFVVACGSEIGQTLRRDEVEDVTQDVMAQVWRKLREFRGDAALETWTYRFCDFELRNWVRRAVRRRSPSLSDGQEPAASLPESSHDIEALHQAIARLPLEESLVVRLKHFESATFEQIGERLSVSPNTAKTRYYRAMESLRQDLHRRTGGEG